MVNIIPTEHFKRQFKPLAKKYRSLKQELAELGASLCEQPYQGTPLARGAFKIRLAIASKNKGKRGGARIITCLRVDPDTSPTSFVNET
jgi:mRNA-degrading endonuclease RelE of RelBE toxin-antitoxin system